MYLSHASLPDRQKWREKMLAQTPERLCWYLQQVTKLIGSNEGKHVSEWNALAQITIDVIQERKIKC
jgi:hypothetical protein